MTWFLVLNPHSFSWFLPSNTVLCENFGAWVPPKIHWEFRRQDRRTSALPTQWVGALQRQTPGGGLDSGGREVWREIWRISTEIPVDSMVSYGLVLFSQQDWAAKWLNQRKWRIVITSKLRLRISNVRIRFNPCKPAANSDIQRWTERHHPFELDIWIVWSNSNLLGP